MQRYRNVCNPPRDIGSIALCYFFESGLVLAVFPLLPDFRVQNWWPDISRRQDDPRLRLPRRNRHLVKDLGPFRFGLVLFGHLIGRVTCGTAGFHFLLHWSGRKICVRRPKREQTKDTTTRSFGTWSSLMAPGVAEEIQHSLLWGSSVGRSTRFVCVL